MKINRPMLILTLLAVVLAGCHSRTTTPTATPATQVADLAQPTPYGGIQAEEQEITLLVHDIGLATHQIEQIATHNSATVLTIQTWQENDSLHALVCLVVPPESFDLAFDDLRQAGQNLSGHGYRMGLEEAITELESDQRTNESTTSRLRRISEQYPNTTDGQEAKAQLARLVAESEWLKSLLKLYQSGTTYSTITVYLTTQNPKP